MAFTVETSESDARLCVCHVSRELANHLHLGSPEGIRFWSPEFFRRLQVASSLHLNRSDWWESAEVQCDGLSESLDLWTTRVTSFVDRE